MSRPITIYTVSKCYGDVSVMDSTRLEIILNCEFYPKFLPRTQEALAWSTYPRINYSKSLLHATYIINSKTYELKDYFELSAVRIIVR